MSNLIELPTNSCTILSKSGGFERESKVVQLKSNVISMSSARDTRRKAKTQSKLDKQDELQLRCNTLEVQLDELKATVQALRGTVFKLLNLLKKEKSIKDSNI